MGHLSNVTSGWPQLTPHDLWQFIIFWSGVLPTKFGSPGHSWATWYLVDPIIALHFGQGFFLPKLVPYNIPKQFDPWLTPADPEWPLTPSLHYTLVGGSSYQSWWPQGISKATWPLDDLCPLMGSLLKYALKPRGPVPYPSDKFQHDTSKSTAKLIAVNTYIHLYILTYILTDLNILVA